MVYENAAEASKMALQTDFERPLVLCIERDQMFFHTRAPTIDAWTSYMLFRVNALRLLQQILKRLGGHILGSFAHKKI